MTRKGWVEDGLVVGVAWTRKEELHGRGIGQSIYIFQRALVPRLLRLTVHHFSSSDSGSCRTNNVANDAKKNSQTSSTTYKICGRHDIFSKLLLRI